jgi:predicted O-methyltransferase YrrM
MLRVFRRKPRRKGRESALDERSLDELLASLPDDVATRLASMYRGEPQRGTDGELHELDEVTRIPVAQALHLFELHRVERPALSIEVGLAYGFSTLVFAAAAREHGGRHVAIDPYAESDWHGVGLVHARAVAEEGRFQHLAERSSTALARLAADGTRAGLVYVDGAHRFDDVMVDMVLSDPLLEEGGLLLLDDTWLPSVQKALRFFETNRADYRREPSPVTNLAVLRKVARDERNWRHFVDF